ncbi:MAG: replicative DNA helicase [Bacteroidetes bacterium]|nr:replicative DNA helicase [Bacteroidota bacterium]
MAKRQNYKKQTQAEDQDILEAQGRIPPQAVEVEEAILGSMLIESDAATIALNLMKTDDFYKPAHRFIYDAMKSLHENGNALDMLTIETELSDQGHLDQIGGSGYLIDLTRAVTSAANIEYHCQIVIEKAIKRNLILTCTDIIKNSYEGTSDPYELVDHAEQKIFSLANSKTRQAGLPISHFIKPTLDHLVEIRGKHGGLTGVPSGLSALDDLTAGWQRSDMIIIAARPSMGKTAFVLTCARNAALYPQDQYRTNVALFSLEMSSQQLVQRLLTMEARIDAQAARQGKLSDNDFTSLISAAGVLNKAGIFIDDTPGISLMELRSKCRRLKEEHNVGIIIIDYLQLMSGGSFEGNREQEIAFISRGLKGMAKELNVPVIALSQLSRAVEQRGTNKRPQLSDLRESGSIEQDADIVCFLYRPEYYGLLTDDDGSSTAGMAELIVGKQRNGPVGTAKLAFIKQYARFENRTRISYDNPLPDYNDDFNPDVGQPVKPKSLRQFKTDDDQANF